ncbi:MAG: GNAT family N-acetyltransferase, partial [Elusimicrobia bacterium]|nr:GNAT family N-acetyltransferase [Elusimicrobiota bacterium]
IQIAHPDFRARLLDEAKELAYVYPDQVPLPSGTSAYPDEHETSARLSGIGSFRVRPIRPTDERALRDLFYSHSPETIFRRYGIPLKRLSRRQIQEFVTLDYDEQMALAAFVGDRTGERMIGVARYYLDRATGLAEIAITIHDDYQGKRLGTFLFRQLAAIAKKRGVAGFVAVVQRENKRMVHLFQAEGSPIESRLSEGTYRLVSRFSSGGPPGVL